MEDGAIWQHGKEFGWGRRQEELQIFRAGIGIPFLTRCLQFSLDECENSAYSVFIVVG